MTFGEDEGRLHFSLAEKISVGSCPSVETAI
jgi:hypothetical protein